MKVAFSFLLISHILLLTCSYLRLRSSQQSLIIPLQDRMKTLIKSPMRSRRSGETPTSNGRQIPTTMASRPQRSTLLYCYGCQPFFLRMKGSPTFITGKPVMRRRIFGRESVYSTLLLTMAATVNSSKVLLSKSMSFFFGILMSADMMAD